MSHSDRCDHNLRDGVHTFTSYSEIDFLRGTARTIARSNIYHNGGVRLAVNRDGIALAIEPLGIEFGEAREGTILDQVPDDLRTIILGSSDTAAALAARHGIEIRAITALRASNDHATVRSSSHRLTQGEREAIRASGETLRALAARYGVSHQAISAIKRSDGTRRQKAVTVGITASMRATLASDLPTAQVMLLTGLSRHYVLRARRGEI